MIKLINLLLEDISPDKIKDIIDIIFPQIVKDRGIGKQGVPKIKLHKDIYARYSGEPEAEGEHSHSSKAEWVYEDNTIYVYYPNMRNEEDIIKSILHEYEHTFQDPKKYDDYRAKGYDNNPYEIAARKAENNWKNYLKYIIDEDELNEGEFCPQCLSEVLEGLHENHQVTEAKFKGKTVTLNKPMRGDSKKFKVYVNSGKKNADGTIKVKKVNFGHGGTTAKKAGQKTMSIRKSNPKARSAFRARHNCTSPGPKTMARYWSCKKW